VADRAHSDTLPRNAWQSPPTQPILPAVKRLVPLLGTVAFAASVATAAEAIIDLRAKAEAGDASAQFRLGVSYANGQGVAQDQVEAAKWYRKAAEQGNAQAQNNLGFVYDLGQGVVKDEVEAVKWYRKAAEQGNAEGQCCLGFVYSSGRGVVKDEVEAAKWHRKAAEQGHAVAQYSLALLYALGQGVYKDQVEAYAWFNLAAVTYDDGRKSRAALEQTLSREEIAAGQRRTRELEKEIEAKRSASAEPR
jgi:hypothetical protein